MKKAAKAFCFLVLAFVPVTQVSAVVSIAHSESVGFGQFLTSTGAQVAAGGVSVGFFNGSQPTPSDSFLQNLSAGTAYSSLVSAGFVDVRTLAGVTLAGGFDWNFDGTTGNGGTVQNVALGALPSSPPAGLQLYVIAFNAGSFVSGNPGTSFSGASEWAMLRDTTWTVPADGQPRNTVLTSVTGGAEVIVGTEFGDNASKDIRLAAVPEPSRVLFGMFGLVALFIRRRR